MSSYEPADLEPEASYLRVVAISHAHNRKSDASHHVLLANVIVEAYTIGPAFRIQAVTRAVAVAVGVPIPAPMSGDSEAPLVHLR